MKVRPTPNRELPSKVGLAEGATGPDVEALQNYLARYGYLQLNPSRLAPEFDNATAAALARYQRFFKLRPTGKLTKATVEMMSHPRCGMPDMNPPGVAGYVSIGSKWNTTSLTHAFFNWCADRTIPETETAVNEGLSWWTDNSPLTITTVLVGVAHDLETKFTSGAHGDGVDFDGTTIAHCWYPAPAGSPYPGDAHFDDATWTFTVDGSGTYDLATVAGHEFGHGLGLNHSGDQSALMWPSILGVHTGLAADDIAGIQSIYPVATNPPPDPGGGTLPAVPAGVSATALSTSSIQISWSAAAGATSYQVGVADSGAGPFPNMDTTAGTSLNATGLAPSTTKYYVVRSVNSSGTSANSSVVNATTLSGTPDPGGGEWVATILKSHRLNMP